MEASATQKTFSKEKFKLNTAVRYHLPDKWNKKKLDDLAVLKIYVNEQDSFVARNLNVSANYVLSFNRVRLSSGSRAGGGGGRRLPRNN